MSKFDLFDRAGRPALRLVGVLLLASMGLAIAYAYWHSALTGAPVPDMTGGMGPMLIAVVPQAVDQITRHLQRNKEIEYNRGAGRGVAPGTSI